MRSRLRNGLAAGVLLALTAGCSSHLSTAELDASNRSAALEIVRSGRPGGTSPATGEGFQPAGTPAVAGSGAGVAGRATPAAGTGSGTADQAGTVVAGNGAPGVAAATSARSATGPTTVKQNAPARTDPGTSQSGAQDRAQGPPISNPLPGAATGPEVVLGSVGTGSGPIGANVASIPVAVRAWAARVNAGGGLGGRPVRVVFGDDGGDPGKALSLARKMVEEDRIVAFVGLYGPTTIQAIIPYASDRGMPIVGGPSAAPEEDSNPIVYNPQAADRAAGQAIVTTVAAQTPLTKVSIFYCREVQSCSVNRQAALEYAGRHNLSVVHEAQVSLAQPDFTAETVSARRAGAEAVVALVDLQSMIRIVRSAARQGWKPVFGGSFAFDTADAEQAADILDGLLSSSLTLDWSASPKMADYRDAVARFVPGGKLGGQGANAWAQGKLIEAAARPVTGPLTSAALIDGLDRLDGETLGGIVPPQRFPKGRAHYNPCIVPIKLTGGKWTQPLGEKFVCD
jgi:branched-chain amino acid transport system substrate-binding protein